MGNLRPYWGSPINVCLLFFSVVIESLLSNMSLHSFRIAGAKINKICEIISIEGKKVYRKGVFSKEAAWKQVNIQRQ